MIRSYPLRSLRFGHDHPSGMNCRVFGRDDRLDTLAATIIADGVLYPLLGFEDNPTGAYVPYVYDGNRRLSALLWLAERGEIDGNVYEVEVDVSDEAPEVLFARSVVANIEREPLHPVDRFEAFGRLETAGQSHEDIANRFGITTRDVRKALALGNLAPVVREAWRAGNIEEDQARAFTLNPDHDAQAAVFAQLSTRSALNDWQIKAAMRGDAAEFFAEVEYVGVAAYRAAGGRTSEDLFSERVFILDPDILHDAVRAKLAPMIGRLKDDGWDWAGWDVDVGRTHTFKQIEVEHELTPEEEAEVGELRGAASQGSSWQEASRRIAEINRNARLRALTMDHMAASGVVIELSTGGRIVLHYGYQRPDQVQAAPAPAEGVAEGREVKAPRDPKPMVDMVREMRTIALQTAVRANPTGAAKLLTAFLRAGPGCGAPVALGSKVFSEREVIPFSLEAQRIAKTPEAGGLIELAEALADYIVATTEAVEGWNNIGVSDDGVALSADILGAEAFDLFARDGFSPRAYFEAAKKHHAVQMARECFGDIAASEVERMKAGAAASWAADQASRVGWLPPQLRSSAYRLEITPDEKTEAPAPKKARGRKAKVQAE